MLPEPDVHPGAVTSETARLAVSHFDLYRIKSESELDELGFDEALDTGAALIEWPERAPHRLREDALHIHLATTGETARRATLTGPKRWAAVCCGRECSPGAN